VTLVTEESPDRPRATDAVGPRDRLARRVNRRALAVRILLFAALGWFYVLCATEHASRVNTFKARGDQSLFLGMAELVYHNWHEDAPAQMMPRNVMPLYPAYQALFYTPQLSDDAYFLVAKKWNIRLSLVLLALLAVVLAWHLPPLVSTNLTVVAAFGYFVFKAGYVQPELLFYFLLFATFLVCCHLLWDRRAGRSLALGAVAGVLAALAHLTKAAMVPFLAVFLLAYGSRELAELVGGWRLREGTLRGRAFGEAGWRIVAAALLLSCFFIVLFPYISRSKHVFGSYFYNANTAYYAWCDSWGEAATGPKALGVETHAPDVPATELPSFGKYWHNHSLRQIASRLLEGFGNMLDRSYQTYWYLKFVALYVAFAGALIAGNWKSFVALCRERWALMFFLASYAVVFATTAAFYNPISATGTTRYIIAQLTPLLFVLAYFSTLPPFRDTSWRLGGIVLTTAHFDLLVSVVLASDIMFTTWSRLMTTYGGF
jgi:hypothetical protein